MDRFAQSPLRLAAGFGDTKPKKTKALKYRTLDADPKILTSRKRRLLQPLALQSPPTPLVPQPRTEKAQRDFELSLQRRDFQQLLWLIANDDVPATYETVGGETALLAAIGAKDEDAFRLLLQCSGISIDARNRHGYTPLMKAIAAAAPFAEAQLEETTRNSLTALTTVRTSNNHPTSENDSTPAGFDNRMIAVVLAHRPDLHAQDAFHQTAFDWATRTRNYAALALLEAHQQQRRTERADFADRDSRLGECVALLRHHDTVTRDMETLLRVPLLAEALLQQPIRDGVARVSRETFEHALNDYTVLTTDRGEAFLCTYFLDRETRDGWTPLLKAAACGFTDTLQVVVALGVDVNYESHRLKHTALTWASYCGHDATVLALLRVPTVDVNRQTREGKTALIHAVANQQLGCIRYLLHAMHAQSVRDAGSKESFHANENAVRLQMSPTTRRPSRWGTRPLSTAGTRRKPGMYEWHELFLEMVSTHDSSGRDALAYANAVGEREEATAIRRELQQALQQAQDHAAYVASHQQQTLPTACKYASDGCTFVAPLDLLPSHELHACPKRQIACDQCGMDIAVEAQTTHDRVVCEQRLVACPNREHGCTLRVPVREAIAHARDHCRKRVVPCRLGCVPPDRLIFERRDLHETTQCILRLIPCPLSCGAAPFPANQRSLHTRQHCRKRVIPCPSGCGIQVRVDEMAFHVSTLCVARRVACQWASHGCGVSIGGTIASRRHHEEMACPFRLVTCKHAACTLPEVLACFLEAHYAWQCSHELVDCPNACGVAPLPRHLMDVHTQLDAGDCWKRLVHCRRDLCGKTLRLYDSEQVNMFTSDTTAEPKAQVSMRGLQERLQRATAFLEMLRKRQKVDEDQEEEEEKGEEEEKKKKKSLYSGGSQRHGRSY